MPTGDLLQFLISGGPLMVPIGLCSVAALAIIIERSVSLARTRVLPAEVLPGAIAALNSESQASLGASELARVLMSGLDASEKGAGEMSDVLNEAIEMAVLRLEHTLTWLGSIAAISPLLGLLGTVLGMIEVFAELMNASGAEVSSLAGGISQALVTTAAGLSVAIPSLLFHNHFERRIARITAEMESAARELVRMKEAVDR